MTYYYDPESIKHLASQQLKTRNTDIVKKAKLYQDLVFQEIRYGFYHLANMEQINQNQIPFSLTRIRKELGRYGSGTKNQYWWDWLHKNFPIVKIVKTGNSINKVSTMVEINIPLEIVLASGNTKDIVKRAYSKFDLDSEIHTVQVDIRSLENYVRASTAQNSPNQTLQDNLKSARMLLSIAKHFDGEIPQIVNRSNFGRIYYRGPNLQSVHKTVREAALGNCYSVDIDSSVFNWKYAMVPFQDELTYTRELIQDKKRVRRYLADLVFGNHEEYSIKTVKQALTAISFGARGDSRCWYKNESNQWTQGAMSEIIYSKEKREELFADHWMKNFMAEQDRINKFIGDQLVEAVNNDQIPEKYLDDLKSIRGRISRGKLIAWAYQQSEQKMMQKLIEWSNSEVLLQVHDGIYFKSKPDILSMQTLLQDEWPLATLSIDEVSKYVYTNVEEIESHRNRIRQEESAAKKFG
jgi:hypothetical protein